MDYAFSKSCLSEALKFMETHDIEMFAQHGRRYHIWRGREHDFLIQDAYLDEKPFINDEDVVRASLNVGQGVGDHFDLLVKVVAILDAQKEIEEENEG